MWLLPNYVCAQSCQVCQSHWTSITSGFFCILGTAEHEQHQCRKKKLKKKQQTLMVQLGARSRTRRHESGMKTNRDSPPPSWWSWCCCCRCCRRRFPGCLSPSARRNPSACPPFFFSFPVSSPLTLPRFQLASRLLNYAASLSGRYFSACCRCERCVSVCVCVLCECVCADVGRLLVCRRRCTCWPRPSQMWCHALNFSVSQQLCLSLLGFYLLLTVSPKSRKRVTINI